MTVTGLSNALAGFLGVIGLVNFSLTAGIIAFNGNASRISFLPAALIMLVVAFMPPLTAIAWSVPPVVVGVILLHIMSLQLAAGLMVLRHRGLARTRSSSVFRRWSVCWCLCRRK